MRVEHVKHSRCRQDFLDRVAENERKKKEAKEHGIIIHCKRQVEFLLNLSCVVTAYFVMLCCDVLAIIIFVLFVIYPWYVKLTSRGFLESWLGTIA